LAGVDAHTIVDVRRLGAMTAVTQTATGAAAFVAATVLGSAAGVLTVAAGVDPWTPVFLGPRRRAQLSADAATAEAVTCCRRHLRAQVADMATRVGMPSFLRASLIAHIQSDLATHANMAGTPTPSPPADRPENFGGEAGGASAPAASAAIFGGEDDASTPPNPNSGASAPASPIPPSGTVVALPSAPMAATAPSPAAGPASLL